VFFFFFVDKLFSDLLQEFNIPSKVPHS